MTILKNKVLLSTIYLGSAVTTILCASFILKSQPSPLTAYLNIGAIVLMLLLTIPLFIRFDIFKLITLRTYSDHIIVASSIVLQTTPHSFVYFYVFVIWIQSFVNTHVLDTDRRVSVFLRIVPLIVCIYSLTFLWKSPLNLYLFNFAVVASVFVLYLLEKQTIRQNALEKAAQAVKDVQYRILIHNIRNQSNQLLLKLSREYPEIESHISSTIDQIIASVGGIKEEKRKTTDIFLLVNRMAAYFSVNYSVKFNLQIRSIPVLLYEQLFLSALYVFFSNSQEAGATRIKVSRNGNLLLIEDNGNGFDTTRIRRGFTTKQNGRGIGLVSALEACEKTGLIVNIESQLECGTKIKVDITNALLLA